MFLILMTNGRFAKGRGNLTKKYLTLKKFLPYFNFRCKILWRMQFQTIINEVIAKDTDVIRDDFINGLVGMFFVHM